MEGGGRAGHPGLDERMRARAPMFPAHRRHNPLFLRQEAPPTRFRPQVKEPENTWSSCCSGPAAHPGQHRHEFVFQILY